MPKGIFIGLGGAGVTTVARLKALLFQRVYGSSKANMDADCSFIFYDTNSIAMKMALANTELREMMGAYPVIDVGNEYIDAGEVSPYRMYQMAKRAPMEDMTSHRIMEWSIDPEGPKHIQLPVAQLNEGASAERMAGRYGFAFCHREFESLVLSGIRKLTQIDYKNILNEHPSIWIFSSCHGGTSSSALLDVLYLVDRLYKNNIANSDPYLRLVLYLPKKYMDYDNKFAQQYALNSYATLWELNEFRIDNELNSGNKFGTFAIRPDKPEWRNLLPWPVCSYVIAVDTECHMGRMSLDQMYENTAEMCYFMHAFSSGQTMISCFDNDFSIGGPYSGNPIISFPDQSKWSRFVMAAGLKSINKADDFLKEYVRKRFYYDIYRGFLGSKFEDVWPTYSKRMEVVEHFVDVHILSHLMNVSKPEQSEKSSLYAHFKAEFDTIISIPEYEIDRHFDVHNFMFECRKIKASLEQKFYESKLIYLDAIKKTVLKGIEENISDFGLYYTYQLLAIVDDEYCEQTLMEMLHYQKTQNNILDFESEVLKTKVGFWGKNAIEMANKLKQYKEACLLSVVSEAILSIIQDITKGPYGLLERLRNGDSTCLGIRGLINYIQYKNCYYEQQYQELADSFFRTKYDVCRNYIPDVSSFVSLGQWKQGHLFEELYSSIVRLDYSKTTPDTGLSSQSIRRTMDERGLADIIDKIMKSSHQHLSFTRLAMCQNVDDEFMTLLSKNIDDYIENAMGNNDSVVKCWLDLPLNSVFEENFINTEGVIDITKKEDYIFRFINSIPLFYPTASGKICQTMNRLFYVGESEALAEMLGYQYDSFYSQFIQDLSIGHRLLVFKFEEGHSFADYKYFDLLNTIYDFNKDKIESEGAGCHIHKGFVHHNIASAYAILNNNEDNRIVNY